MLNKPIFNVFIAGSPGTPALPPETICIADPPPNNGGGGGSSGGGNPCTLVDSNCGPSGCFPIYECH